MMAKQNQKTFNKIQKDKVETENNLADKVRKLEAEKMQITKMRNETEQGLKELKAKEETLRLKEDMLEKRDNKNDEKELKLEEKEKKLKITKQDLNKKISK